jgi:hypothetical protein
MSPAARRITWIVCVAMMLALGAGGAYAQIRRGGHVWAGACGGCEPPRRATKDTFRGGFNLCRLEFISNRREKRGWGTDYPGADINFSIRLAELTSTRVTRDRNGDPEHIVVRATDEELFRCPFVLMEDGGTAIFSDEEVTRLRAYLLKGGFLLAADYWGTRARAQFDEEIGRVLPRSKYPILDVPSDHPVWKMLMDVTQVPQMASIQFWLRSGGGISERGLDSQHVDVRGIADEHGRLMVLMLHNTDIPDGWEREAENPTYFYKFSPGAYAVGIDVLLYAMTH